MVSSAPNFRIPQLWKGERVFILGGGPSLMDEDLSLIYNEKVIGVNDAFKLGDWVDVAWSTDCQWLKWNEKQLDGFKGIKLSAPPCRCKHDVIKIARKHQSGICTDPSLVYWSRSSGASAINLAYHLGAVEVVLLGFDMKMRGNNHNWHSNHQHTPRPTIYQQLFIKQFDKIAEDAKSLGLKIINATCDTDLVAFPRQTLQEVVDGKGN